MGMVSSFLKIGQISDTHIRGKSVLSQDAITLQNFVKVIRDVQKEDLDLVVFSGDLAENRAEEDYEVFFKLIEDLKKPWCFISGNHDDNFLIEKKSPVPVHLVDGKLFYKKKINDVPLFFLDSSFGIISNDQLEWMKREAEKEKGEVILFVHHPPCLCGHRFMDANHALQNISEVVDALHQIKNLKSIFVGHYHSEMKVDMGCGQTVYVAPSTQMQLDPHVGEFKISSFSPAWRMIEYKDGALSTKVHFL